MSLVLSEIRLTPDQDRQDLKEVLAALLSIPSDSIQAVRILRRSVDARRHLRIQYQVEIDVADEASLFAAIKASGPVPVERRDPSPGAASAVQKVCFARRPVVVGFGPAGIFAALILARAGAEPIVLERGSPMKDRVRDVERFWSAGVFSGESNVCFGEGGAGTFSDGKLTTRKRAPEIPWLLQAFVDAGAPPEILYESRPHIGTDRLRQVIVNLRKRIEQLGGEVRFRSPVTDLLIQGGRVRGVRINNEDEIKTDIVVLSPGHGARDTLAMLLRHGVMMDPKALAIGVRIEHPQEVIDRMQYGRWAGHPRMGAADYRLTFHDREEQRGVYSFCMCPGGAVIGATPEAEGLVTNGMSTYRRNSGFANSGIVVTIHPADFGEPEPLAGMAFVRRLEKAAFQAGGGGYFAPAQRVTDFIRNRTSSTLPDVTYRPGTWAVDLADLLPLFVTGPLRRALSHWDRKMPGFVSREAALIGVETRTSSPVRILREKDYGAIGLAGLYPVGEGAGYAGGIVSSALDGMGCAQSIVDKKVTK